MSEQPAIPGSLLPASVVGNRWVDIEVSEIGEWGPSRTVTVVIPHYERQSELSLTLAALTGQTYPRELLQVVVVDDGSSAPPDVSEFEGMLDLSVRSQERRAYGAGRARNLGARHATGEILIFLDCDMIPERQHVEAHARWHHSVSDAVIVGFRFHADFSGISATDIATATMRGDLRSLLEGREVKRPEWIEREMARTQMLTSKHDDLFVVMSSGNISLRREMFIEAGGFDESFERWGGEDNELGFRLIQLGLVIVADRQAVCWHQGEGHEPSPEELESARLQKPKMLNLIAETSYRKARPGRSYTVPYAVVGVDGRSAPADMTSRTVDSILGSRFHDLVVHIVQPYDAVDSEWLRELYASDGRVQFVASKAELKSGHRFSSLRLDVPSGVLFHPETMGRIVDVVGGSGVGILRSTVPSARQSTVEILAYSTRAMSRAQRVVGARGRIESVIGELFGERRTSRWILGIGFSSETSGDVVALRARRPIGTIDAKVALKRILVRVKVKARVVVRWLQRSVKKNPR